MIMIFMACCILFSNCENTGINYEKLNCFVMPRGKHRHGGQGRSRGKQRERITRTALRRERKSGAYLNPGDPDFKSFANQLAVQGLALKDVPGDG